MTNIMKIINKILIILLILQIIFAVENISHAGFWGDIISSGGEFLNQGKEASEQGKYVVESGDGGKAEISLPENRKLREVINDIYGILFPLGVGITVVIGGIIGIKFMMASAEDKAKVKEALVPYVIGCIVIYGAFAIWRLAIIIFGGLS